MLAAAVVDDHAVAGEENQRGLDVGLGAGDGADARRVGAGRGEREVAAAAHVTVPVPTPAVIATGPETRAVVSEGVSVTVEPYAVAVLL